MATKERALSGGTVRLKTVALPAEHGSWGLVLEPILLGLLVGPSWGGALLAVAAFAAFLLRWPLKVAYAEWHRQRRQRLVAAIKFIGLYGLIALVAFVGAVWLAGWAMLLPLVLALPFGLIFLWYDLYNQSRSWQAELTAPVAFSAVATSLALIDGWSTGPAYALWGVLVARAIPSILYVRSRIRLERGKPHNTGWPVITHLIALIGVGGLIWLRFLPVLPIAAFLLLLGRAMVGLSQYRRPVSIKVVGFTEMGLGLLLVLSVALGYWLGF